MPQALMIVNTLEKPGCLCLINDGIVMTGNYCFSVQSVALQFIHRVAVNKTSHQEN